MKFQTNNNKYETICRTQELLLWIVYFGATTLSDLKKEAFAMMSCPQPFDVAS